MESLAGERRRREGEEGGRNLFRSIRERGGVEEVSATGSNVFWIPP